MPPNPKWIESLEPQLKESREALRGRQPEEIAARSGTAWKTTDDSSWFEIDFFGALYVVSWPALVAQAPDGRVCSNLEQAFLLHYLLLADGTPLEGSWVSLAGLPNGAFYEQAFQSYSGNLLARALRGRPHQLKQAAESLGGDPASIGDQAYRFWALPRIPLALVYWSGGEEFPDSVQVLFDASAGHYQHLEMLAHLGALLCQKLTEKVKAASGSGPK